MLNGQTIEIQIRTAAMHQVAEKGMAAHWAYTDEKKRKLSSSSSNNSFKYNTNELYNTPWLSSIKEWQDDETEVVNSRDFVDCVRRELLGKRVFVFLRNGKILNLARGATVIDAAFQIHTEVGLTMHGVHINGNHVSVRIEYRQLRISFCSFLFLIIKIMVVVSFTGTIFIRTSKWRCSFHPDK